MKKITTFGEVMLRLSPSDKGERLIQASQFKVEPGGSESNVAIALSNLGLSTRFITKLPDNALTHKILNNLKQFDVDTESIVIKGDKLGIYWTENGIGPRNSFVIYDRDNTSFSSMTIDDFNWEEIFKDSSWFHFSGISPSVSENVFNVLKQAVSKIDIPYSVDLNFRSKLWKWVDKEAFEIKTKMEHLCKGATLLAGNESDFQDVLSIHSGKDSSEGIYDEVAFKCFEKFPMLKYVSISIREAISASSNDWSGVMYVKDSDDFRFSSIKYRIEPIEDRVGTGDSFVAGIIYGLINDQMTSMQGIVDFASTLAALNHTISGDSSIFTSAEVFNVLRSKGSGRIIR
jgi:2-dehydro-3-deoxygluconokinase